MEKGKRDRETRPAARGADGETKKQGAKTTPALAAGHLPANNTGHIRAVCKQKLLRHIARRHNADAEASCQEPLTK
jgi:hypothetical protein